MKIDSLQDKLREDIRTTEWGHYFFVTLDKNLPFDLYLDFAGQNTVQRSVYLCATAYKYDKG